MIVTLFACLLALQGPTPEVIEHSQAGAKAREQGRLDEAIQEFRKVTLLQPNSSTAHADLGDAYFQKGDFSAAIPELERALKLSPNLMATHQTLGVALLVQGNPEAALPHLEKMRSPELLGLAYLETGRLGSAVTALQAALGKKPDDPDLLYYFGRAAALTSKRSFEQLVRVSPDLARKSSAFDQLSRVDPDLARKGTAAGDAGKAPKEIDKLLNSLAKQPNDPDLLFTLSRMASLVSRETFDRLLQSNPDSARAHQVKAERYFESRRFPEAEREYIEALRLKPNTSNVHHALGDVYAAEGNWPAAIEQLRIETRLQPANADAFYGLGTILLKHGTASDAVDELAKADGLKPDTPQILMALGSAALAANDAPRAEASWIKLLGIEKTGTLAAAAHFELGGLYRRAGKTQEAEREMAAYEQLRSHRGR